MSRTFKRGEKPDVQLGDTVELGSTRHKVVKCQETGVLMINIDEHEIEKGDLAYLKSIGLTISNPNTKKPVALGVDFEDKSFGQKISEWFESDDDDDDWMWGGSTGGFLGGGGFGGSFGGGFGGFGGGGAARGF